MVIGTTGWYDKLPDMSALAERRGAALLYGTNFSIGVQIMLKLAERDGRLSQRRRLQLLHRPKPTTVSKLDAPPAPPSPCATSCSAAAPAPTSAIPIEAIRTGDAIGIHVLEAAGPADRIILTHESMSRRAFAEGAVRAAEWLSNRTGVYDFRDVFDQLASNFVSSNHCHPTMPCRPRIRVSSSRAT